MIRRSKSLARRVLQVSNAFTRMEARSNFNYPVGWVMRQLAALSPVVIYYFVSGLVTPGTNVGGDYYTFVVVGLIATQMLDVGMRSFSIELERALERGWFEMILVTPLRWTFLPLAMVQWSIVQATIRTVIMIAIAVGLGAQFDPSGLLPGLIILLLAIVTGLAFGILLAGMKVLAKSGDPLLPLYTLGAQVFSGVYFPVESLPEWLQPVSLLFPHTYVITALRRTVMPGGADLPGMSATTAIGVLLAMTVILFPVAMVIYRRSMELGRRMGVLAGY
jgi:ABC-2 type transport system permease protein